MKFLRISHYLLILFFICPPSLAQAPLATWDMVFAKAEKQYTKGKFSKVEKKLKKLRGKDLSKKYRSDSTLLGLAYLMEAKAYEGMSEYATMESKVAQGFETLEKYAPRNPYAYTMGYLRMVDLYNLYGNHRKADSLLQIVEMRGANSDLLTREVVLRRALTWIEIGYYLEADSLLKELAPVFPAMMGARYGAEPLSKYDQAYRKELLGLIYVSQIRILTERGFFQEAENQFKPVGKKISGLVAANSPTSTYFNYLEAYNYYNWKDYKEAQKVTSRTLGSAVSPIWAEELMDLDIAANLHNKEFDEALSTSEKQEKTFSKLKTDRSYLAFKQKVTAAMIAASEGEEANSLTRYFSLSSGVTSLPADHRIRTQILTNAIEYATSSGLSNNYAAAEKFYLELDKSLKARYPIVSVPVAINSISIAGYYLNYSESPGNAFPYLRNRPDRLPMRELSVNHPLYQKLVDDLREYYVITGNYDYPIKLKKEVVESLRKNPNTSSQVLGKSLSELASLQTLGGYYKEAELNTEESLKLIRREGDKKSVEYVKALNTAAFLYGTMGLYDKAERLLNEVGSLTRKVEFNDKSVKLNSVEDLAFLYTRLGEYTVTEELLKESIASKISTYTTSSHRLIKPYRALGELYLIKGEYPDAEKYLRQAYDLSRKTYGDTTLLFAETLMKMALLDLELGVYKEALDKANKIQKIRFSKLRSDHVLIADTYQLIGQIYFLSGLGSDEAVSYFEKTRDIIGVNFSAKHPLYAEALKNIAFVKIELGNLDEALSLLEQADNIWEISVGNRNKSSGEVARLKGDIYNYKGDFRSAKREYEKSARYFRKIFNAQHPEYLTTQSRLARAYFIEGDVKQVEEILSTTTASYIAYTKTYFPTLSEEEKAKFWVKIKPDFEFYNSVAVKLMDTKPKYLEDMFDYALMTKGLLLSSSIKTRNAILNSGDAELIALFEKWLANKEYLTNILSQSDEDLIANEIDPEKIKEETFLLEKQLSEQSEAFTESFEYRMYNWAEVQAVLKPNEAAVEMVRYREFDERFNEEKVRYAALILTAETKRNPILVLLPNGNLMEKKGFNLQRNAVKFKINEDQSYKTFWEPISEAVKDKSTVFFSPDGVYNQINVESLFMGTDEFVIDKMNVRVVNSTKTLAIVRSKDAKKVKKAAPTAVGPLTALIVGNPVYYENAENESLAKDATRSGNNLFVPQLPGTEAETKTLTELLRENNWNVDFYLGDEADEKTIKKSQNRTLVHIATHGFFDEKAKETTGFNLLEEENPLDRSGLMAKGAGDVLMKTDKNYNVEDGILTATEAMNLNFEGTELVVLSACETGRGELKQGEGVFGLQRSFLVAGADAIIMSLFKVSDEVTQNLMIEFYKNWLAGDEKRIAFNKAQKTIKENYPEPIYWGAFTMIAKS